MINDVNYNHLGGKRDYVKALIEEKKYKTIDVGASAMYWSYPECKYVADSVEIKIDDSKYFKLNLENKDTWTELLDYVDEFGKFDFSICSHTLEDVFNPTDLIELLEKISYQGFVAIPSKYNEFKKLYENLYRGNAHHKQFFDVKEKTLVIYPKFSWTETHKKTEDVLLFDKGDELSFFWTEKIPHRVFGRDVPFNSDGELINNFYQEILN